MAFKMKGSAFKLGNVATKSALKQQASPMKVAGGKYLDSIDEDGTTISKQLSDADYAAIERRNEMLQTEADELSEKGNSELAHHKNSQIRQLTKTGLENTDYANIEEAQEALGNIPDKIESKDFRGKTIMVDNPEHTKLANILHYEMSETGEKETKNQNRLNEGN